MTKRELLYEDIKHMREVEGLKWREIGDVIGLALTTVRQYYDDPTGEKAAARKAKKDGKCIDCGARTKSDGGNPPLRCQRCDNDYRHATRVWTADTIVDAIQRWADEHGGIPPVATDWNATFARLRGKPERSSEYPTVTAVQREFGSWNAAIEVAGFEPFGRGQYGRDGELPAVLAETVALYRSGISAEAIGRRMGVTATAVYRRLERAGEPRRPAGGRRAA